MDHHANSLSVTVTLRLPAHSSASSALPTLSLSAAIAQSIIFIMTTPADSSSPSIHRGLTNDVSTIVTESIDGFLLSNPQCRKLDGGSAIKVVLRSDWDASTTSHVALISGGGDGHAPSHTGFVGEGMLTAAVCGETFASPSVAAVLAAIRAVARSSNTADSSTPAPGVLLIVKNYTGDRLNFGLALSQASLEGIPTEMVIVCDDVALPRSKGVTGRRGVAGTVLVHKIAGAAAAEGMDLKTVAARAQEAANSIVSMGVAWSTAQVPGRPAEERLKQGEMEIGLGIHNEAGNRGTSKMGSAREVAQDLIASLLSRDKEHDYFWRDDEHSEARDMKAGTEVLLLVNNLGSATAAEMNILSKECMNILTSKPYEFKIRRLLVGTFMTALNMSGVSVSIMRLSNNPDRARWQLQALDRDVGASGWPKLPQTEPIIPRPIPVPQAPSTTSSSSVTSASESQRLSLDAASVTALLTSFSSILHTNVAHLNELDAKAGDGDCGSTLNIAAHAIDEQLLADKDRLQHTCQEGLHQLLQLLARTIGERMGGSSGAIVQILLTAAATESQRLAQPDASSPSSSSSRSSLPLTLASSLHAGVGAVSKFGGANQGDRTMLDALIPALNAFQSSLAGGSSTKDAVKAGMEAARKGSEATKNMTARAGRSNYVSGAALSEPDPGAVAVALLWEAAYSSL